MTTLRNFQDVELEVKRTNLEVERLLTDVRLILDRINHITGISGSFSASPSLATDHGILSGLGDDDHTQYILVSGTRPFTGDQSHGDFDITNVGDIGLDSITADASIITINNDTTFLGTLTIPDFIFHAGDLDTLINFSDDQITLQAGGKFMLTLTEAAQDLITLGPGSGDVDIDFNGDMFLRGSDGYLGIGVDPTVKLDVLGTITGTTITGANVTSGADPGHTHTGASLSTIDISDDTNLVGGSGITLNDDTLDLDINSLAVAAIAAGDFVPFWDITATATNKKITFANLEGTIDHGNIAGTGDDDHSQYALLAGRATGQTLIGGTASGENLILQSTAHATRGSILFGTSAYDEVNNRLGVGTVNPGANLQVGAGADAPFQSYEGIYAAINGIAQITCRNNSNDVEVGMFAHSNLNAYIGTWTNHELHIRTNNTDAIVIETSGDIGVGIALPDGSFHIHTATAGSVTANAGADELVLENSTSGGMSILVPNASTSQIIFGSPSDSIGAIVNWNYNSKLMVIGSQTASGEIRMVTGAGTTTMQLDSSQNVGIRTPDQFGSGTGVLGVKDAGVNPSTNPTGGGVLYSDAGAGKWRSSGGTTTTFGPAEPHCKVCGRDFVLEWENKKTGHLIVCMWCLTEKLGEEEWITRVN